MPLFYFILNAGRHIFPDKKGEEFPDEAGARAYAQTVARELMRNREARTSHWRVEVCDDYLKPCYECLFADVDKKLEAFGEKARLSVTAVARTTAFMNDALRNIDAGMAELRQTVDRIDSILSSRPRAN
jgi:hypothetical protein